MNTYFKLLFSVFLLLASFIMISTASHALDEQSILKQFQNYARENNIIVNFNSAEVTADNALIIKGFDYFDEKRNDKQTAESIKFGNLREVSDGKIEYDSIEVINFEQNTKIGEDTIIATIDRAITTGLKFSNASDAKGIWPNYTAKGEITNLTINSARDGRKSKITFPSMTVTDLSKISHRNFVAKSVQVSPSSGTVEIKNGPATFNIDAMSIENMEFFGAKGFDIGLIDIGNFDMNFQNNKAQKIGVVFEGLSIENFFSADLSVEGSPLVSTKDLNVQIKPLTATINGQAFSGWVKGVGSTKNDEAKNTLTSDFRIDGLYLDLNNVPETGQNPQTLKTLKELNLLNVVLNLDGSVKWNKSTGLLDITNYEVTLEDGASFKMNARFTGYTEQIATQFSQALSKANAETDPQKRRSLNLQATTLLAALSIERMEIALEDRSLLDRVINYQASKLNQEPDQIKGLVGPLTTIVLSPYNIPQIAAQTSQALGVFIQGNKTLRIISEPNKGLSVIEMLGLFTGARSGAISPAELAERLNLQITAE